MMRQSGEMRASQRRGIQRDLCESDCFAARAASRFIDNTLKEAIWHTPVSVTGRS
jgi:hypothetical protein